MVAFARERSACAPGLRSGSAVARLTACLSASRLTPSVQLGDDAATTRTNRINKAGKEKEMAEDKDDVKGHELFENAKTEPPRKPGEAEARPEDDDDVAGHEAMRSAEGGKKAAPGESI